IKYSRILTGEPEIPTHYARNDFFVNWSHTQVPKSNPSIRFSANVNAGSSSYNTNNATQTAAYLQNTFQSNIAWSKSWKFGTLSANLRHSQNIFTHDVQLSLPQLSFSANRFYPFRDPKRVKTSWYNKIGDKIGMSYTSEFQNNLSIKDTDLTWNNRAYVESKLQNGVHQTIPVSASFNVARHYTLTIAAAANSITQFRYVNKVWTLGGINSDSGYVKTDTLNGTKVSLDYNASATLNTKFYGMYYPRHTRFTAIRHTVTPGVSFTYMPDFTDPKYGFYRTVQSSEFGATSTYSIFEGGVYGSPAAGKMGAIGFNVMNSLEGKKRPKDGDTTSAEQRIFLIDALNAGISYNMMAQHFNWSNIAMGFRTKLFKKFDVNASAIADPYKINDLGTRIERFEWRDGKRLARLTSATLAVNTSLRQGGLTSSTTHQSGRGTDAELNMINANPNAYVDFNIPWSLTMGYSLTWAKPGLTTTVTQNLRFSGDVNVTPKWKVGFDSNFDIQKKEFGYTSLNVYRDLHCWEMQFNWIPFGLRQSYNITINVKSAMLQDLKLTRKRDWYDFTNY
ncbi:MAG TPA: putative LPS assembly protein LptD, partial [Bacteroidia bacterium]|nr:putative LPS assembly protein LptD [Bacteroidia bacterium]